MKIFILFLMLTIHSINFEIKSDHNKNPLIMSKSALLDSKTIPYSDTTYQIISSINKTYGYEIIINKKAIIRQPNIPGIPGLTGFKNKEDAEKVAKLVIKKIIMGKMPPVVTQEDMYSLNIVL